ncbi:MAG: phospholipase D family protein [Pikeienuella sp.]|uniref:phospholipase D family protein n=1 Tax=Pikeienuella sp. TaxID=2831957 RepID=UPI00391C6C3E
MAKRRSGATPLITAAEAFPLLERRAASAEREVSLLFRVFDTRMTLRDEAARDLARAEGGGEDWAGLLVAVARKGVKVRLQVSDFDPIGGAALHREAWASLRHLSARAASAGGGLPIEAMAARHPAGLGLFWRRLFAARARRELKRIHAQEEDAFATHPSLRGAAEASPPRLFPVTHHQKVAVVDGAFALVGGLDFDERRWDTPDHDRPAAETWRDVTLAVDGPAVAGVAHAGAAIWSDASADWAERDDRAALPSLAEPRVWRAEPEGEPDPLLAVVMTRSVPAGGAFAFAPRRTDGETERAVLGLIWSARRFLYIETQFIRCRRVVDALTAAARAEPRLELVLVLPFAPEAYAFEGRRDTATRHGEALQLRTLRRLRAAFGERAAILSPAKPARRKKADDFVAHGAGAVYVHSKVLIADGVAALIGSANLNGRSLRWDTEVSLVWRDEAEVGAFQARLAESWLGEPHGPPDRAATWREAATLNASKPPDLRKGFLLPHDMKRPARFGRIFPLLPDDLF